MTATTSRHSIPYPTPSDEQRDFTATAKTAMEKIDGLIAGENQIVVNGRIYRASGAWNSIPSFSFNSYANNEVHTGTISFPIPYAPPAGYTFETFQLQSGGFSIVQTGNVTSTKVNVRIIQIKNSSTTALSCVGWRLTKL